MSESDSPVLILEEGEEARMPKHKTLPTSAHTPPTFLVLRPGRILGCQAVLLTAADRCAAKFKVFRSVGISGLIVIYLLQAGDT